MIHKYHCEFSFNHYILVKMVHKMSCTILYSNTYFRIHRANFILPVSTSHEHERLNRKRREKREKHSILFGQESKLFTIKVNYETEHWRMESWQCGKRSRGPKLLHGAGLSWNWKHGCMQKKSRFHLGPVELCREFIVLALLVCTCRWRARKDWPTGLLARRSSAAWRCSCMPCRRKKKKIQTGLICKCHLNPVIPKF